MSTTINKTDGTVLTTIADGAVDTSTTNLAFIGRLYRNYGELVNENFIKLLENFASAAAPSAPQVGQIWYDTDAAALKVYRSTGFVTISVSAVSSSQPNSPSLGDQWYDTADQQLKLWNGSEWVVIAPPYSATQGLSGVFPVTVEDTAFQNHIAIITYQQGNPIIVSSRDAEYTPRSAISGFTSIKRGINLTSLSGFKLQGTATDSELLNSLTSDQFLRSDAADEATETITFSNATGLIIGDSGDMEVGYSGSSVVFRKTNSGPIEFFVNNSVKAFEANDTNPGIALVDGTASIPSLSFIEDPDTGISRLAPNVMSLNANGNSIVTIQNGGSIVNGTLTANALATGGTITALSGSIPTLTVGTSLTAPTISGVSNFLDGATMTGAFTALGTIQLGDSVADTVTHEAGILSVPNGLAVNDGVVTFNDQVIANTTAVVGLDLTVGRDAIINDDAFISNELLVQYDAPSGFSTFRVTGDRKILINTNGPKVASNNPGDVTLGDFNTVYAANTAKYWAVWQDDDVTSGLLNAAGVGVIGSTEQTNSTTSSLPSGLAEDDVVFAFESSDSGPAAAPTGYTEITSGTNNNVTYSVSYKVMTATPDTEATGLVAASNYVFTAVRGVNTGDIVDQFTAIGSDSSGMPDSPSITTTADNTLVFSVGWLDDQASVDVEPPSGFNLAGAAGRTESGNGSTTMAAFRRLPDAGTIDPGVFSATSDNTGNWASYTFSVNLNAGGSGFQMLGGYNVDSVTRLSDGVYRINFTYAMTDQSYYSVVGMGNATNMNIETFPVGGTYVDVTTEDSGTPSNINTYMSVVIHGI